MDRPHYLIDPENVVVNFGALPPLPDGYCVVWHQNLEHYIAWGPDWESPITCDRFQARRWCFGWAADPHNRES